ncbi:hypothetical protein Nmel_006299 [Mimus melanotis]
MNNSAGLTRCWGMGSEASKSQTAYPLNRTNTGSHAEISLFRRGTLLQTLFLKIIPLRRKKPKVFLTCPFLGFRTVFPML